MDAIRGFAAIAALSFSLCWARSAAAQYDDEGWEDVEDYGEFDEGEVFVVPGRGTVVQGASAPAHDVASASTSVPGAPAASGDVVRVPESLYCDGTRYPLEEERADTGPARLVRLAELTRTINVVGRATDPDRCGGSTDGECAGLHKALDRSRYRGSEMFLSAEQQTDLYACMLDPIRTWNQQEGRCQELRHAMSELRRLDREALARAEYVLAVRLCDRAAGLDARVRSACEHMRTALAPHAPPSGGRPPFWLDAPLPRLVQEAVRRVALVTGGNFDVDALDSDLARDYRCRTEGAGGEGGGALTAPCLQYDLLRRVADACRLADVYVDERGSVHVSPTLSDDEGRSRATLCVDVSDFAPEHPLLVGVGIGATRSRPARVWPGEPILVGNNLPGPVDRGDVLSIEVRGKPRGISLAETLRVNGVPLESPDACRLARAYVPVVDHEVPVGGPGQAIIPASFFSGRIGETGTIEQGDAVMIWVRDIEPSGAVRVEYGDEEGPQYVGYIPPPLIGQAEGLSEEERFAEAHRPPGAHIRPSAAGVDQPLVPRRARYPGSRVLRMGTPAGFFEYPVRVCTYSADRATLAQGGMAPPIRGCGDPRASVVLDERIYVHGRYYFGVRAAFLGTWFPARRLVARQTPEAALGGPDMWQVVAESADAFDFDVGLLLALYPFGRDPYSFDYRFWDLSDGRYWNDVAVLVGFSMVRNPLEHMFAGVSLPLYSGVSLSVLAHFERRGVPVGVRAGDVFRHDGGEPDVGALYGVEEQFVTGVAFGLSVDYDLFERAFKAIWDRVIAEPPAFRSTGRGRGDW